MEVSVEQLLQIIGRQHVELELLRARLAQLEAQAGPPSSATILVPGD